MAQRRMIDAWFQTPARLQSFVVDLLMAELAALRQSLPLSLSMPDDDQLSFGESDLQLDSLELTALSVALSRAIHLAESNIEENLFSQPSLANWLLIAHKSLTVYSEFISFKTSGSTGLKKYHRHALVQLEQEAQFLGQLFKGRQRIVCAVPSHHIYGFIFSVLLPRTLEPSVPVIDIRGLSPNAVQSKLRRGDLIIGYPEFWQCLDGANVQFPADIVGINSSGPCQPEVGINLLENSLSGFYEVYGSSETAGIGWRDHPLKAYTLFPFWQKAPVDTAVIRLFTADKPLTLSLQDNVRWLSHTQFIVKGRKDAMVQIGGINVSLSAVRAILIKHPLVKDAAVRMMRPEEGARLKAFIVLNEGAHVSVDEPNKINPTDIVNQLQQYINTHLSTAERPKSISLGLDIPRNHMGKYCDWSI